LEIFQDVVDPRAHAILAVPLLQDDGGEHVARTARVVVDDNIAIPIVTADLPERHREAAGDLLLRVEGAAAEAALEDLVGGGHDEDAVRLGVAGEDALGPLDVDVHQHVDPLLQAGEDLVVRGAVVVVVDLRPLEELVAGDHRLEGGVVDEVVVAAVDLAAARRARGMADREGEAAEVGQCALHHAVDERRLAGAGRRRQDEQLAALDRLAQGVRGDGTARAPRRAGG